MVIDVETISSSLVWAGRMSDLATVAIDGELGVRGVCRDTQIRIGPDRDVPAACVRLDVDVVDVEHCDAAGAQGHVRQREIDDDARLQNRLHETGSATGS